MNQISRPPRPQAKPRRWPSGRQRTLYPLCIDERDIAAIVAQHHVFDEGYSRPEGETRTSESHPLLTYKVLPRGYSILSGCGP